MKSREFGAWPPRNIFGAQRQKLYDEYNRALKKERPEQPKEYASSGVEEYYRVPEMKDVSGNPYEQNSGVVSERSKKSRKSKPMQRQLLLRQVAGVLVGSVIVVTTYQAMAEQKAPPDIPAIVETTEDNTKTTPDPTDAAQVSLFPNWQWSEDNQTVILELFDTNGNLVKELPAVVSVSETAAACNKEGLKTYTAAVEDEDKTYSDTRTEPLPPLGHAFTDGKEVVLENGQTAVTFECDRCHEQFTITISMTENEN